MRHFRRRLPPVIFALLSCACSRSSDDGRPQPSKSAQAAPTVSAVAPAVSAAASASFDASTTPRTCEITAEVERRALANCVEPFISPRVGYIGAFTERVARGDDGHLYRDGKVLTSTACEAAARALAAHGACTWDVRGPAPQWTVRVVAK